MRLEHNLEGKICALTLALAIVFSMTASPSDATTCSGRNQPAATLLFPYFEVDLSAGDPADKRTTLVSIANATSEATLTRVVIWSDLGVPTLSFNLYLGPDAVQSINLAHLFRQGVGPSTGPSEASEDFASCAFPQTPTIDVETLQAQHSGQPHPQDGLCYGSGQGGGALATGYLTVDVVNDCSAEVQTPHDPGYFSTDGNDGLASSANRLFGDFFLIDPGQDLATGQEAVALVADEDRFGPDIGQVRGFYGRFDSNAADERSPLGERHLMRFLQGGSFDASTEILLFMGTSLPERPVDCAGIGAENFTFFVFNEYAEDGTLADPVLNSTYQPPSQTSRVRLADLIDPSTDFGSLEIQSIYFNAFPGVPATGPLQSWVMPLVEAQNRFSISSSASQTEGPCN